MGWKDLIYNNSPSVIRTLLLNGYALFLNLERYGKKFENLSNDFSRNDRLSLAEIKEYQRERLKIIIRHAYEHVPYYREIMYKRKLVPEDFKDLPDITKMPVLTREDIKKSFEKLKADNVPWYMVRHGHTSGTTGSPLNFLWDVSVCVAHHAADWRQKEWAGFRFGEPFASLQGRQIVPSVNRKPPFWIMNHIHNQLFVSSFHLKGDYLPYIIDKLAEFSPKGFEGYPSSIYILAWYLKKSGRYLPLPAVLTSSETLLPIQRELIEERFQCKVYDFYGMAERVVYGSECRYGKKHVNEDYGITEIVNAQDETLNAGEAGTIVATSLWNLAMPLIRYRTSDVSSISIESCSCGCSFPVMAEITTKAEDIVVLPDGRLVPSSILTHPFKPLDTIKKSQILQSEPDKLLVKIVPDDDFHEDVITKLLAGLHERVGNDISISIEVVEDIPVSNNGKFRWVISKVDLP